MTLEAPKVVRQGGSVGIKLRASGAHALQQLAYGGGIRREKTHPVGHVYVERNHGELEKHGFENIQKSVCVQPFAICCYYGVIVLSFQFGFKCARRRGRRFRAIQNYYERFAYCLQAFYGTLLRSRITLTRDIGNAAVRGHAYAYRGVVFDDLFGTDSRSLCKRNGFFAPWSVNKAGFAVLVKAGSPLGYKAYAIYQPYVRGRVFYTYLRRLRRNEFRFRSHNAFAGSRLRQFAKDKERKIIVTNLPATPMTKYENNNTPVPQAFIICIVGGFFTIKKLRLTASAKTMCIILYA